MTCCQRGKKYLPTLWEVHDFESLSHHLRIQTKPTMQVKPWCEKRVEETAGLFQALFLFGFYLCRCQAG